MINLLEQMPNKNKFFMHDTILPDYSLDTLLTDFGKATLTDRYLSEGERYQDLFLRVAKYYADDSAHASRLYYYISNLWFMPSTPILSNGGTKRGLPISCFLNEIDDSLKSIVEIWNENVWLAAKGGGIGSYWGNLRSIGEKVKQSGETSGIIPFIRVQDSLTLAISQGSLRRGSAAVYLPIWHPEIEEFLELRKPTGGDPHRKALNLHHAVVISDAFMNAVENDALWSLRSPKDNSVIREISARGLWVKILTIRIENGEPYIIYIDNVNNNIPESYKKLGLNVKMSNLCSEITLATGKDHLNEDRTAVCCLSSLNLEYFDDWKGDKQFIEDVVRFLDNVLEDFIKKSPDTMNKASYAAIRERSIGLGVMGFHSFLQKRNTPFESLPAKLLNKQIFQHIRTNAKLVSKKLALIKGACPDAIEAGLQERFSNIIAVAPTASISIIAGGASPGIEPFAANAFLQKTLTGSYVYRNKYLEQLLEKKGKNNPAIWSSITTHEGSVQHLDFLTQDEKMVFKTAFEIDQRWVIDLAADRTPYICQSQSLNLFILPNIHKSDLHNLHFSAWKKGIKSLYYCRSASAQRADKVSHNQKRYSYKDNNSSDECLSCQ